MIIAWDQEVVEFKMREQITTRCQKMTLYPPTPNYKVSLSFKIATSVSSFHAGNTNFDSLGRLLGLKNYPIKRRKCEISNLESRRQVAVFSSQEVEGEMDPGNFSSIPQFMESAGVYRFLTQIPTCWITAKVLRRSLRIVFKHHHLCCHKI